MEFFFYLEFILKYIKNWTSHVETYRWILKNKTKIKLQLHFFSWFRSKRNSIWYKINQKRVIKIQIWIYLARLKKQFLKSFRNQIAFIKLPAFDNDTRPRMEKKKVRWIGFPISNVSEWSSNTLNIASSMFFPEHCQFNARSFRWFDAK